MSERTEQLLLECLSANSDKEFKNAVEDFFGKKHEIDWPIILEAGLQAFLPVYLEAKALSVDFEIPKEINEKIKLHYISTVVNNERIKKAILEIAEEFNKAKTDVIFFKGGALLCTVYNHDIGLRTMSDLDILVRKDELTIADDILRRFGYKEDCGISNHPREWFSKYHFHYMYYRDKFRLEVHWNIIREFDLLALKRLFESSEKSTVEGAEIMVLSAEANIFIACFTFFNNFPSMILDKWPKSQKESNNVLYRSIYFFYEIKKMLKFYKGKIAWDNFLFFVKSTKSEYDIFVLLILAKEVVKADVPEYILKKAKRNIAVYLFMLLCHRSGYGDIRELLINRGKVSRFQRNILLFMNPRLLIERLYLTQILKRGSVNKARPYK